MGLLDWLLGRDYATPAGDLSGAKAGVAGRDGDSSYGDFMTTGISYDANPAFRSRARWMIYNEMRTDPMIRSLLWLYKLPIRSAVWDVAPAGGGKDPVDRAVAEACRWQFGLGDFEGKLSVSWDEWLTQRLLCLDWGAVFEEIIWSADLDWWRDPTDADQQRPIRTISRLGLRRPSSISKVEWDDSTGRIKSVEQDLPDTRPIPGDRIAHYAIERDGEFDWMGTSLLRSMYGPWRMKRPLMLSSAIAWDRWASGLPIVRYPSGGGADKQQRAEKIGQNVRTHERAYVVFEGTEADGWDLKIETATVPDPTGLLHYYDQQMGTSVLSMFGSLGQTETGSRAVGEVLIDPYFLAVSAVAKQIALDSTRDVFRPFVDVNFGTQVETPRATVRKLSHQSAASVVNAITLLSGAGFNVRDPKILNTLLEMLDLDKLPEGESAVAEGEDAFPGAARRTAGRSAATTRAALAGGGIPGALA
jgi:hypothetical protein